MTPASLEQPSLTRLTVGRPNLPMAGVTLLLLVTLALSGSGLGIGGAREAALNGEQGTRQTETIRQARLVRAITVARTVRRQEERPPTRDELRVRQSILAHASHLAIMPSAQCVCVQQITPSDRARQGMLGLAPPSVG